jgi:hypothetical protein
MPFTAEPNSSSGKAITSSTHLKVFIILTLSSRGRKLIPFFFFSHSSEFTQTTT